MGEYNYSKGEKELLKVLENQRIKINATSASVDKNIAETEKLIAETQKLADKLGKELPSFVPNDTRNSIKIKRTDIPSWEKLVENANEEIPYQPEIEDFLSASEIQYCKADIERINNLFAQKTKLCKTDLVFLMIASALQTARWIIIQQLVGDLGQTIESPKELKKAMKSKRKLNMNTIRNIQTEIILKAKNIRHGKTLSLVNIQRQMVQKQKDDAPMMHKMAVQLDLMKVARVSIGKTP